MDNYSYVIKVIMSCRTEEQLESCSKWIDGLVIKTRDVMENYRMRLDFNKTIQEQRLYLNRLGEIEV